MAQTIRPDARPATLRPVIARRLPTAALLVACTLAAGCVNMAPPPPEDKRNLRDRVVLSRQLLELADYTQSVMTETVTQDLLQHTDPVQLASMSRLRTSMVATVRAMALSADPEEGLIRLYVWAQLAEWTCENRVRSNPEMVANNCEQTSGRIRLQVERLAARALDANVRSRLDAIVVRYKQEHPGQLNVGMMRIDDVAAPGSVDAGVIENAQDSMLSPVTDAARQLEQTRLLGDRLAWLLTRMPGSIGDEADSATRMLMESDRVREAMAHAEKVTSGMAVTAQGLHELADAQYALSAKLEVLGKSIDVVGEEARAIHREASIAALAIGVPMLGAVSIGLWSIARAIRGRGQAPGASGSR
jgi:hypothetical protein